MFDTLQKNIKGFVTLEIEGFFIEKFLNLCKVNNLVLYNVKSNSSCMIEFDIEAKEVKNIKKIVKMTKCKMKINKKTGLPFVMNKYRKRKYVLFLIIICIMVFIAAQSIIWEININVDDEELYPVIEVELRKLNINVFTNKYLIDKEEVREILMINIPSLSWIELEFSGIVLNVEAKTIKKPPQIINDKTNCNIIASKRGVIDRVIVKYGNAVVKKDDIVEVGDILISGYVDSELQEDWLLHAQGDVYAKIWYNARMVVPFNDISTIYTGNEKIYYGINTKKNKVFFGKLSTIYEEYDTMLQKQNIKIFNYVLPIYFYKYIYQEKNTNIVKRTYEEAVEYGKNVLFKYLNIQVPENVFINDIIINTSIIEDNLHIEVIYECIEEIGVEQNIY